MGYYIGYLIVVFIQSIYIDALSCYSKNKKNKIFIILSCFELIIFTGLRADNVGADTLVYISAVDTYSYFNIKELITIGNIYPYRFEIGYLWITKISAYLGFSHTFFLIIISVLIYIPTHQFFYRYSPYPILSIAIYFGLGLFEYSLGIFRQYIAISIVLLGINYILKKQLIKWTIIVGISMLFHTSAILCYPLYFISHFIFKKIFLLTIALQPILYFISVPLIVFFTLFFPKYFTYFGKNNELNGTTSMLIIYNILLIIYYLYNKQRNIVVYSMNFFINSLAILCCIQAMAYAFPILGRAIPYFSIFITVTIPRIIKDMFPPRQALVIVAACSLLFILLFIYQNIDNTYILPFRFFWET